MAGVICGKGRNRRLCERAVTGSVFFGQNSTNTVGKLDKGLGVYGISR